MFTYRLALPRFLKTPVLTSWLVSAVVLLLVLGSLFAVPPQVPLLYSLALPSQQLAAREWLFLFPALSILMSLGHSFLLTKLYAQASLDELMLRIFAWTSVAWQGILGLALLRIVWIVA
jgi:hypothetical protein